MIDLEINNLTDAIESKMDRSKWKTYKFSDLVDNIVEKVVPKNSGLQHYIGLEHLDAGSLKIKRFGETESLVGDKLKIYKDDLIFAKRNSYLKRVAIADFDAVASAHSMVLRPKAKNVDPNFLPFFMMSEIFWKRAIEISVGSLSPTINWKSLAKQEFLLPPKAEQARLAELLWAMDEVIEKEKVVFEKLEISFKTIRNHFVENGTFDSTKNSKKTRFGKVCANWQVQKLSSFAELINGYAFKSEEFLESGKFQVLRIGNITDNGFDYSKSAVFKNVISEAENKFLIPKGAVVLSLTGTNGRRDYGFPSLMDDDKKFLLNQRLVMIIPKKEVMLPEFLFLISKMELFQGRFFLNATGTANQANVSSSDVALIELPVPPIKEQIKFLKIIDSLRLGIANSNNKITASQSLQKSLINQIF